MRRPPGFVARTLLAAPLALAMLISTTPDAWGAERVFRAGAFAQDITPTRFPVAITGSMAPVTAQGVHDPLHARCLVLDDGQTQIAIVVIDSCAAPREILDAAKELAAKSTGIPVERMLMSATHTHTAPSLFGGFQNDLDAEYAELATRQIAKGVKQAFDRLTPARIGWGAADEPSEVHNRRWFLKPGTAPADPFGNTRDVVKMNPGYQNPNLVRPAGPIDPQVSVVSIQTRDGKPLALLANYSLHYVGGVEPVSADYFGAFAQRIGKLLGAGPEFVGIMSNGTSGDVNNIDYSKPAPERLPSGEKMVRVADKIAQVAYKAAQSIEYQDWTPIHMRERELELGVRRPTPDEVTRAREILAKAEARGDGLKALDEIYARETVFLADYPPTVKVRLQAIRLGELGIVSSPCETFAETGLKIKRESPLKPTFTIELANGASGYLPTPEQHGWGGYETWRARSSLLEVEAEPKIVGTLLELLAEVAKQ